MESFTGNLEHENSNGGDERRINFLCSLPQGYRFCPTPPEVILKYLIPKNSNKSMPNFHDIVMPEVDVYERNPGDLIEANALDPDIEEMYFITSRKRKYRQGRRPARKAGDGYWKPVGKDKLIIHNDQQIGLRKVLDFYIGKATEGGTKTDWKMHEYKTEGEMKQTTIKDPLKLDAWVICKIYKRKKRKNGTKEVNSEPMNNTSEQDNSDETGSSQLNYSHDGISMAEYCLPNLSDEHDPLEYNYNFGLGDFIDQQAVCQSDGVFYDPSFTMGGY